MKKRVITKRVLDNWNTITTVFTPEHIESMTEMKEYVVGFKKTNKSFCYLVEVGTKELGDIRGPNSSKFGLWFGTHGKDKERKYRATKRNFGEDVNKAFSELKTEIARVIRIAQKQKVFSDFDSILTPLFKYKIIYLYNKDLILPGYSFADLNHFEDYLGLPISKSYEKAQLQLMKYRDQHFSSMDNYTFMCSLYEKFGRNNGVSYEELNQREDDKLNRALQTENVANVDYVSHPVEKAELIKVKDGGCFYPRDRKVSAIALAKAHYQCEANEHHHCFIKKRNGLPYTEVHHLIPLSAHSKFSNSLDVPENIVSLCSNCHNEIHYGRDAKILIEKLYNERKDLLKKAGIEITLEKLTEMYK